MKTSVFIQLLMSCLLLLIACEPPYLIELDAEEKTQLNGRVYEYLEKNGEQFDLEEFLLKPYPAPNVNVVTLVEVNSIFSNNETYEVPADIAVSNEKGEFSAPLYYSDDTRYRVVLEDTPYTHYQFKGGKQDDIDILVFKWVPIVLEFVSKNPNEELVLDRLKYEFEHTSILPINESVILSPKYTHVVGSKSIRAEMASNINLRLKYKLNPSDSFRIVEFYTGNEERGVIKIEVE